LPSRYAATSAVRRLLTPEQEKERHALLTVEQTGREALAEMRRQHRARFAAIPQGDSRCSDFLASCHDRIKKIQHTPLRGNEELDLSSSAIRLPVSRPSLIAVAVLTCLLALASAYPDDPWMERRGAGSL
jgi:hypothetical protein